MDHVHPFAVIVVGIYTLDLCTLDDQGEVDCFAPFSKGAETIAPDLPLWPYWALACWHYNSENISDEGGIEDGFDVTPFDPS